jgi:hypothetical protein
MIQGDIDLTEKLDFYHDKPTEKLLPATLPWQKDKNGLVSSDDSFTFRWIMSNVDSNTITLINTDAELNWSQNEFDIVWYNDYRFDTNTWQISNNGQNSTLYISTSTPSITTSTTNLNSIYEYDSWGSLNISCTNSTSTSSQISFTTKSTKKKLDLPYKVRPSIEEKKAIFYSCSRCRKKFISTNPRINYCKECARKEDIDNNAREAKFHLKRTRKNRGSIHMPINLWNAGSYYLPWDNNFCEWDDKRPKGLRGIPWLTELQSRIFNDYKEELENGEKDYSSYLTNMGWLGIH